MALEFPRMVYRVGTQWVLESGKYDLRKVADEGDLSAAVADGWHLDQYAALDASQAADKSATASDENAKPTRAELEQKAAELGLKFDGRTSDRKLADAIAAKLKA